MKKFYTARRFTAIFSLVLALALSAVWATQTYNSSKVYQLGEGSEFVVMEESDREVDVGVPVGSLDAYLEEQGLNSVTITAKMTEELVYCNGDTHYHLTFEFGPSGTYFDADAPLELDIEGEYVTTGDGCEVWLYDENGEAVESEKSTSENEMTFYIPHFSSYYYDDYDY